MAPKRPRERGPQRAAGRWCGGPDSPPSWTSPSRPPRLRDGAAACFPPATAVQLLGAFRTPRELSSRFRRANGLVKSTCLVAKDRHPTPNPPTRCWLPAVPGKRAALGLRERSSALSPPPSKIKRHAAIAFTVSARGGRPSGPPRWGRCSMDGKSGDWRKNKHPLRPPRGPVTMAPEKILRTPNMFFRPPPGVAASNNVLGLVVVFAPPSPSGPGRAARCLGRYWLHPLGVPCLNHPPSLPRH